MFQNESLNGACCVKAKEDTVLDNVRETRDILMKTSDCLERLKTSDCLERLKTFLKVTPEECNCVRADAIPDFYNDVADLKTVAFENLAKVRAIMDIIGLEG